MQNQRGMALILATVVALICAAGTYAMLMMATSQARWSVAVTQHEQARYLSEAGVIWATQRIWQDPAFCTGGPQLIPLAGASVEVTVTNCALGPHQIHSRVVY